MTKRKEVLLKDIISSSNKIMWVNITVLLMLCIWQIFYIFELKDVISIMSEKISVIVGHNENLKHNQNKLAKVIINMEQTHSMQEAQDTLNKKPKGGITGFIVFAAFCGVIGWLIKNGTI